MEEQSTQKHEYRTLASFQEYLLIDQEQPIVDALFRESDQYWRMQTIIGLDKIVPVHSLGIEIPMRSLYAGLEGLAEPQISIDL